MSVRAGAGLWVLLLACGEADVDRPDSGPGPIACVANAQTNGLEVCNGIDDDCDGMTDEGASGGALRQPCMSQCGGGTEECLLGQWQSCSARTPGLETCNGVDDDCDGTLDEGCACVHGETRSCGVEVGACQPGLEQCINGAWSGNCLGAVEPALAELCNNAIDDDCNGMIDEGCQCQPAETRGCGTDVGECTAGTITCGADSRWGACEQSTEPAAERCNGLDDNCDGESDWNQATDFGWRADPFEGNDSCAAAEVMEDAVDGGDWIKPAVSDPTDLRTYPTIHPIGDVDWYSFNATTVSHGVCFPGASQCAFVLVVQLEISDPSTKDDYRVCVATTSDCGAVTPNTTICTDLTHWREDATSYVLALKWGGTCGADDSRAVKVRVESRDAAMACGYYQLHSHFYFDPTEACP